jgi:hypothetical protein
VLVAHACNPTYSGGRDQEDRGLKPPQANSSWDPTLKNRSQKQGWWSGSRWRPWVRNPAPQKQTKSLFLASSLIHSFIHSIRRSVKCLFVHLLYPRNCISSWGSEVRAKDLPQSKEGANKMRRKDNPGGGYRAVLKEWASNSDWWEQRRFLRQCELGFHLG